MDIQKILFKLLPQIHYFCVTVGLLALIQVQKFPLHSHRLELNSHQKPTGEVWYFLDILFMISEKKLEISHKIIFPSLVVQDHKTHS